MQKNKQITSFIQFRTYCLKLAQNLNELSGWISSYQVSNNKFLRQHDGQYLLIQVHTEQFFIKINLVYSLSYQIPIFMFMVYDLDNMQIIDANSIYTQLMNKSSQLAPEKADTGIHICRNTINNQYFYSLHSCELNMPIKYLVPYYLSLIGLHPIIKLQ